MTFYENNKDFSSVRDDLEAIRKYLESCDMEIESDRKEKIKKMVNENENFLVFSSKNENIFNSLKKECFDLENIFDELGLWSFSKALKQFMEKLNNVNFSNFESEKQKIILIKEKFEKILQNLVSQFISETDEQNPEKILEFSSDKLKKMLDVFFDFKTNSQNFHSIIFVERKSIAYSIDLVLKELAQTETWSFIKNDYISSITGGKKNMTLTQQV